MARAPAFRAAEALMRDTRADLLRWCGWFLVFAAALFELLALRYLTVVTLPEGAAARGFSVLMFVSQGVVLASLAFVLLLPVVLLLPRRRWVVPAGLLLALAWLTLIVVDGFVWQQYRLHLDASIWNLVTGGAIDETFDFPLRSYLKLGTIALALAAMLAGCAWLAGRLVRRRGRLAGPMLAITLAVIVVAHNGVHVWASAAGYTPVTGQARILPFYRPLTAKHWLREHGLMPRSREPIMLAASVGLNYPRAPLACERLSSRPNLMFVVVDSWRADALTPEVTPNLARLAGESQRFDHHVSGGNATRIGMFSLFYGLPGTYWHDMLGERRGAVLIQELMRQGYDVAVFRSAPLFSPELDRTIFLGVPGLRLRSDGERAWQRDRDLTTDFIGWLDRRDPSRPFFALLFYDSPHKYDFPPDWPLKFQPSWNEVDYLALTNSTDPEPFRNRYLNSVRYVDRLAGEAIDVVRARELLDRTVLLVTSDHGQEFNDQHMNYWGHNSNFSRFQTHVPLFVRWPGLAPSVHDHETSHFDVAPTLLNRVLGCRNPSGDYSVGRDLFDTADRGVLTLATFRDYAAVVPGERHVVVWRTGGVETLGPDYRPRPMSAADRAALEEALEQRSRFRPVDDRS
jgi:membrane-anchored protein YejM (alkaline phosphatase superfamily)